MLAVFRFSQANHCAVKLFLLTASLISCVKYNRTAQRIEGEKGSDRHACMLYTQFF